MKSLPALLAALALLAAGSSVVLAQGASASLTKNPDMEADADGNGWPDGWPKLKAGGSWENEAGNHFIRLAASEPGKTTMLYTEIAIPEGVAELELTWRWRVTGLVVGKQSWFDARIMMEFMDGNRAKVAGSPKAPATRKDTDGWVQKSTRFAVPAGARILKFMPSLFQVDAGTLDLDDIVLRPAPPAAAPAP